MAHEEFDIRALPHRTLLVHGRDDKVIPLSTTLTLLELLEDSQAHIFGRCGHWTQIEHTKAFSRLVVDFLA
ncbi:MAG: alpha/beta fold hydrolase [Dermatophilaceae bacterium]